MSNFKDFIGGGGGGGADKLNLLTPTSGFKVLVKISTTYTPSTDCTVVVTCIGAGGGGGQISGNENFTVTGGAAGGVCQSELSLTSGTTYTLTIGSGGNASNTGGNTTFTGSNITDMTANGGAAGGYASTGGSTTKAGGTAVGGNIANHTGGSASVTAANSSGSFGGAACGFFETGKNSASSTSTNMTIGAGINILPTDLMPELASDSSGGASAGGSGYHTAGAGAFGCGGGAGYTRIYSSSNSHSVIGGKGGIGAGGGGGYAWNNRSGNSAGANGGAGGNGLVILEFV